MTARIAEAPAAARGDRAEPEPPGERNRWPAFIAGLFTIAMVAGLARELFSTGLAGLHALVPESPFFYAALALFYVAAPTCDYLIYRRLWDLPPAGFVALVKKRIANDVLFGYSGDAYFYTWARANAAAAAPFGAVKDVAILSAIAGNAVTLAGIALALPIAARLLDTDEMQVLLGSIAVIFAMSLPFLIFSKRVFTLLRERLWWIFGMHCLRLVATSTLLALAWHFALPEVSVGLWLMLVAGRLLVSRLPLVPNKDLVFANFAIILMGDNGAVTGLVALTAALTLLAHATLIAAFGAHALTRKWT
jgi:hypothetical protein